MTDTRYSGTVFMYPCAGRDIAQPITEFGSRFDTMLFVDISYQFDTRFQMPKVDEWQELVGSVQIEGPKTHRMRYVQEGNHRRRETEPAWRRSRFQHLSSGRAITVVLRRGFGQYALHEVTDGTLAMFLHRGDSGGEGGSGVSYFANRRMKHAPISCLFNTIKRKLATPALLASDGSNTSIPELFRAGQKGDDIAEFQRQGLLWRRKCTLERPGDRRLTVVWEVTPWE